LKDCYDARADDCLSFVDIEPGYCSTLKQIIEISIQAFIKTSKVTTIKSRNSFSVKREI